MYVMYQIIKVPSGTVAVTLRLKKNIVNYDNLYKWFLVSGFREKDQRIGKNAKNNSYMYMLSN